MNNKDLLILLGKPGCQSIDIPRDKLMPLIRYAVKTGYKENIDIDMITKFDKGLVIVKSDKNKPKIHL